MAQGLAYLALLERAQTARMNANFAKANAGQWSTEHEDIHRVARDTEAEARYWERRARDRS
ncbi:MAG: hypothetical protein HY455_02415 [Parcubacteria group bacterium]|nr:hypothetical protein [Parcubacteria group bacterium]